jgi:hypothetical protein
MKIRIPVGIPGDIIDHCFGNTDLAVLAEESGARLR